MPKKDLEIIEEEEKNPVGRPHKPIDFSLVEKLANIQCTQEEIASVLDIHVRTLLRDEEFCQIYKTARENGRMALRRSQYKSALNGNTTMLVWLGKQYLGQKDKSEVDNIHEVVIQVDIDAEDEGD